MRVSTGWALGVALSFFLLGCSGGPETIQEDNLFATISDPIRALAKPGEVQVFFMPGRLGMIEKCGCSMRPLGGIDREWNALQQFRAKSDSLYLAAGPAFSFGVGKKSELLLHRQKASLMNEAMGLLGVNVYGVAYSDLLLGEDFLQELSSKGKVPFISANIVDKKTKQPLFKPYFEAVYGGRKFFVTAVTPNIDKGRKFAKAQILSPEESLKTVFANAKDGFVIVLSQLSESQHESIGKTFPQIRLILGGDGARFDLAPAQDSSTLIRMTPESQGKVLSVVNLKFPEKGEPTQLYSEETASSWRAFTPTWDLKLGDLTRKIEFAKKGVPIVEEWKKEKASIQEKLGQVKGITEPREGRLEYRAHFIELDAKYETANSPLSGLMTRYQELSSKKAAKQLK